MTAKNREELLDLIPAYALGALDDDERGEVEAWLQQDQDAQALLASYRQVADHLVALAPLRPAPDHLRADLRRRLASEPCSAAGVQPVTRQAGLIHFLLKHRFAQGLAAAALVVLVALGLFAARSGLTGDPDSTPSAKALFYQLEEQAGSSKYAAVPGELHEVVSGELVISADGKQAVLCIWDLPLISEDQVLQMWLVDQNGARTSGGVFQASGMEHAVYVNVPFGDTLSSYKAVGISLEPAGGSPYVDRPSGPRVLSVQLS